MKNKEVIEMLNIIKDSAQEADRFIIDDNGNLISVRKYTLLEDISKESLDFVINMAIEAIPKI